MTLNQPFGALFPTPSAPVSSSFLIVNGSQSSPLWISLALCVLPSSPLCLLPRFLISQLGKPFPLVSLPLVLSPLIHAPWPETRPIVLSGPLLAVSSKREVGWSQRQDGGHHSWSAPPLPLGRSTPVAWLDTVSFSPTGPGSSLLGPWSQLALCLSQPSLPDAVKVPVQTGLC